MKNKVKIIVISLVLIIALFLFFILANKIPLDKKYVENNTLQGFCQDDSDCTPANVCHPTSCVLKSELKPSDRFCTQECAPNTLDCGQGSCSCVNNKCKAIIGG